MNYRQKVGKFGENLAANYLEKHGYRILDVNIKTSYKEIDIIAKINQKTVFVEVKTRTSKTLGEADEIIGSKKINNLKKAMAMYLKNHKNINQKNIRLDLISVFINKNKEIANIKHYRDIF